LEYSHPVPGCVYTHKTLDLKMYIAIIFRCLTAKSQVVIAERAGLPSMTKRQTRLATELDRLEHFKRLVVAAMFSDQELNQRFVLKGGNAIDLVLQVGTRASIDIDLSIETDFAREQLENIRQRLEQSLESVFSREGYKVFDVTLEEKPPSVSPEIAQFWGGYSVTFKLIEAAEYRPGADALESMRRNAIHFGPKGKFEIDISKFEYCPARQAAEIEGHQVFAYTPEMLVCEKLRAICQQMPEYGPIVKRTRPGSARARDFVDVRVLIERFSIELLHADNLDLLSRTFAAKKVPLKLLANVAPYRDFHRPDFQSVLDSVKPGVILEEFDFYFDYVVALGNRLLKSFGDK